MKSHSRMTAVERGEHEALEYIKELKGRGVDYWQLTRIATNCARDTYKHKDAISQYVAHFKSVCFEQNVVLY